MEKSENRPNGRGGSSICYTGVDDVYLIVGGADRQPYEFADLWLLKVVKEKGGLQFGWRRLKDVEEFKARTGHSSVYYNGRVYIFGGQSFRENRHNNELWEYRVDSELLQRRLTKSPPPVRNSHGAAVDAKNGKMYVFGGANDNGLLKDLVW